MDKIIVTAFLVIAGAISSIFLFNAIYPTIGQGGAAITSMEDRIGERLKSEVEIIHAAKSGADVLIWAKNTGSVRFGVPEAADLFFGPQGNYVRIPFGSGLPHWEYTVENDSEWNPAATLRITIVGYSPLNSGIYYAKLSLPSGVTNDYFFSW